MKTKLDPRRFLAMVSAAALLLLLPSCTDAPATGDSPAADAGAVEFRYTEDSRIAGSPTDYDIVFHVDDLTLSAADIADPNSTLDEVFDEKFGDQAIDRSLDQYGSMITFPSTNAEEIILQIDPGRVINYGGNTTDFTSYAGFDINGLSVGRPYEEIYELFGAPTPDEALPERQLNLRQAAYKADFTDDYYFFENGAYLMFSSKYGLLNQIVLVYHD